ncbi:hypothetical protein AU489_07100 [Lonsdalea populi]|uniref:Uncharacterized protein n=2 Tax=Lonsdalea TaxID=1082702 RepID=A0ACD1JGA0_9GAMM|nr:hypothetical protein AU485_02000 [Lonsdalea quercina]RAT23873.1 hypothetical protein AU487_00555 [Lonsdalea populi]RAT25458.1 hypothetical protein AU489_07100 [Lonsdalea populi]RAT28486.1 hypothetical protein AU488_00460 [Lonsdalea populi]RAT38292.1 hypothetical protein AU492_00500 [Lonsdalea populi]
MQGDNVGFSAIPVVTRTVIAVLEIFLLKVVLAVIEGLKSANTRGMIASFDYRPFFTAYKGGRRII